MWTERLELFAFTRPRNGPPGPVERTERGEIIVEPLGFGTRADEYFPPVLRSRCSEDFPFDAVLQSQVRINAQVLEAGANELLLLTMTEGTEIFHLVPSS